MRANHIMIFLLLSLLLLASCAQSGRGIAPAEPVLPTAPVPQTPPEQTVRLLTATPEAQASPTGGQALRTEDASPLPPQATREPALTGQWVEFRDPTYGFGLALPCWWPYSPIPTQGSGGTMTVRSYNQAYFLANSTKGWWTGGDWPEGALKVDLSIWQDFDPSLSTLEAFNTTFDPTTSEIASTQEVRISENEALLVEMRNLVNTADANSRLYIFRPDSGTLLMVSAAPDRSLDSSDVQAILESLSLSPEQPVRLPQVAPSPAIIPLPESCAINP